MGTEPVVSYPIGDAIGRVLRGIQAWSRGTLASIKGHTSIMYTELNESNKSLREFQERP